MKALYRSRRQRILGGVCGGIAEQFGWDVSTVRFLTVVACLFPGPQVLIYIAAWVLLPER